MQRWQRVFKHAPLAILLCLGKRDKGQSRRSNCPQSSASPSDAGARPVSRASRQASSLGSPLRRGPHCNASPGPGHLNLSSLRPSNLPVLRTLQRSALQGATASSRQEGSKALARACRDCRSVSCDGVLFPLPPFPLKMFKGAKACFSRLC